MLLGWSEGNGRTAVRAKGEVSMKALGIAEIKAPLGAFTVADAIEWEADAVFVEQAAVAS